MNFSRDSVSRRVVVRGMAAASLLMGTAAKADSRPIVDTTGGALAFVFRSAPAWAQTSDKSLETRIDAAVGKILAEGVTPGSEVGVMRNGQLYPSANVTIVVLNNARGQAGRVLEAVAQAVFEK